MKNNILFKELQRQEELVFGEKSYPLSSNISERLIPIAETLLNRIPAYMPEYTLHDIKHCEAILSNISQIIPKDVELNIVELFILIHAVILHDIGMVINRTKAEKIKESTEFKRLFIEFDKNSTEDEILTEFIRRTHVQRSLEYIDDIKSDFATYKICLEYKSIDLSHWIKNVIESHALSINKLLDDDNYPTEKIIDCYSVNIQYLSILLRLGDILDFDIFRTPYFLYKHINPENKISEAEWQKHLSIEGKIVSDTIIKFDAKCSSARIERSIHSFVDWIEEERKESLAILKKTRSSKYKLNLDSNVELKVRNDGSYIYTDLKLQLDYKKVLNILMGTELYDTPDIFIRELLQNSYDACKYRQELASNDGEAYVPRISIEYSTESNILTIEDNGIGIDQVAFENYILKIGNSFYTSKSFERENLKFVPISNFGIGILSCFMVSNTIQIDSYKYNRAAEKNLPVNYTLHFNDRYIDKKISTKSSTGTKIILNLHDEYSEKLKTKSIVEIIDENMAHQIIPIKIIIDGKECLLSENKIIIPEDYKAINDIEIIELDSINWLEGFVVIHKGQHQGIIEQNKISQQGFTITTKKTQHNVNLNIGWLQFCRFFINILPENKLNLRASRNSIKEDEKFLKLKNTLIELLVDYFSKSDKKEVLNNYLDSGRGNVLSGNQKEFDFLIENLNILSVNPQTLVSTKIHIKTFLNKLNSESRVFVMSPILYNKMFNNPAFRTEILKAHHIVIADNLINFFYQFARPFTISNEIIVSDIPGLVYNKLVIHKNKAWHANYFNTTYSWSRSYNICQNQDYNSIFCVVNNNQYNSMDIQVNENHRLGMLLKKAEKTTYAKRFIGSLKTNITSAILSNQKLEKYISHNGESHYMVNNYIPYSLDTIGILKKTFLESLNDSLINELVLPLEKMELVDSNEVNSYKLGCCDFPTWWNEK